MIVCRVYEDTGTKSAPKFSLGPECVGFKFKEGIDKLKIKPVMELPCQLDLTKYYNKINNRKAICKSWVYSVS